MNRPLTSNRTLQSSHHREAFFAPTEGALDFRCNIFRRPLLGYVMMLCQRQELLVELLLLLLVRHYFPWITLRHLLVMSLLCWCPIVLSVHGLKAPVRRETRGGITTPHRRFRHEVLPFALGFILFLQNGTV